MEGIRSVSINLVSWSPHKDKDMILLLCITGRKQIKGSVTFVA